MKLDSNGYKLIQGFEGLKLSAYKDSAGIPTIGYGNIAYENGSKVKMGDKISQDNADLLFQYFANRFASQVDAVVTATVNQNQFNAMVSLAYNIGIGAFSKSTLLKKVNKNSCDPTIKDEFMKWKLAGGKVIQGLINRREKESKIYFSN